MASIPIDDGMAAQIAYLMKRTGLDAAGIVRAAITESYETERRIETDETPAAHERIVFSENELCAALDEAMAEKIRYIADRIGRDPQRVLREAIDAAYDLERQEDCDEIENAAFMHATNEEDPIDWEKARQAETGERGRWPCMLKSVRPDTVPVTVDLDADVHEWAARRLFGSSTQPWPDISEAISCVMRALSGLGQDALIDVLDGLERGGQQTVARALFGRVSPHHLAAVKALVTAATLAARHEPEEIRRNLPYEAVLRETVRKIISVAGADRLDPYVPIQQP